jgi:hypothetical protein
MNEIGRNCFAKGWQCLILRPSSYSSALYILAMAQQARRAIWILEGLVSDHDALVLLSLKLT